MKSNKWIKLTLMILICVLVILIGFFGIYVKNNNSYINKLPEYLLASDLKGATVVEFEVDSSTKTNYYNKDGKKVESSAVTDDNKKDYIEKEEVVNAKENLTAQNYKKVVNIMKKRLSFLKADQYNIDYDKNTGKIVLTFEDDYPDDIKSILPMEGRFELIDSNTNDVIIDHNDVESAEATYASLDEGYNIYINLKLNKSGLEKINNIDKYKAKENSEQAEASNSDSQNKFKIMFDDDELKEISYDDIVLTGKTLRLTTNKNVTASSTVQSEMTTNTVLSKLITIGKMPVIYNISAQEYVKTNTICYVQYILIALVVICVLVSIIIIVKYKLDGLLTVLTFITNISLFLILIRLAKVSISLNGYVAMLTIIVLNTILINNILKSIKNKDKTFSENVKQAYLKTIDALIISIFIFAVFAFSSMTVINSMGLLLFWGWLVVVLGNFIFTLPLLYIAKNK